MPPSGSSTSPLPVSTSSTSLSATIISASRLRRYLSVRQSLASSTAARSSWPECCSSFFSSRSNSVKASAVAPAKPAMTLPSAPRRRTLRALGFITVLPIETWPSPAMTVLPPLLTPMMVVPCHCIRPWRASRSSMAADMGDPDRSFNPWLGSAAAAAALPAADARCADLADIAEQILEEAALAAQGRRFVVLGADARDLLHPGAIGGDHVPRRVEAHREHGVLGDARSGERP